MPTSFKKSADGDSFGVTLRAMHKLRKPCANCPFLKVGAIELDAGRLAGIVSGLLEDDWSTFQCHKTVHSHRTGGCWDDDGSYQPSGKESMCAGAAIYLLKVGRPTVGMRIAQTLGLLHPDDLMAHAHEVIEPIAGGRTTNSTHKKDARHG